MSLKIEVIMEEEIPILRIDGELTIATLDKHLPLQTEILKRARKADYKIILDLTRTRFLDGKGMICLIEISEIIRMRDGKIGIVTDNNLFKWIFKLEKFSDLFMIFDSLTEATFVFADFANPPHN